MSDIKHLFLLVFAMSGIAVFAGAPGIVINKDSASPLTVPFADIESIRFVSGGIEIRGSETHAFSFSDISTMHFDLDGKTDNIVNVEAGSDVPLTYDFFTVAGIKVLSTKARNVAEIDISSLASGIYIVKTENKSFKFVKR